MKKALIVKNITREGPGLLKDIFEEHEIGYEVVDLDAGDDLPDPTSFDAIVVLGGPDSANDSSDKILNEISMVEKALEKEIPIFGVCLGLQVLVKAAKGSVTKSPKEVGFKDPEGNYFELVKEKEDLLLENVPFPRPIFHLHGEMVELTNSMELIASGKWCRNQLVKVRENAYGIQGHLELTKDMLELWIEKDPDLEPFNKEELLSDYGFIKKEYEETAKQFFTNFLRIANLI